MLTITDCSGHGRSANSKSFAILRDWGASGPPLTLDNKVVLSQLLRKYWHAESTPLYARVALSI